MSRSAFQPPSCNNPRTCTAASSFQATCSGLLSYAQREVWVLDELDQPENSA